MSAVTALSQPAGDTDFECVAIGDAGYPGPILRTVASTLEQHTLAVSGGAATNRALVFLGDNFYPIGLNVDSNRLRTLIDEVINPHRTTLQRYGPNNVFAVPGNHDYYCDELGPIPYGTCFGGVRREANLGFWQFAGNKPRLERYPVRKGSSDSVELVFVNSCRFLLTNPDTWHVYMDFLRNMLHESSVDGTVRWRFLFMHHSPFSVGEHGGYGYWDDDAHRVKYCDPCFRDGQDPKKAVERMAGYNEEVCSERYAMYRDSLFHTILLSGAPVQITFAGHDHSLQALHQKDAPPGLPSLFVVSGAGSKQDLVGSPRQDSSLGISIFSHPTNDETLRGQSSFGFAVVRVTHDCVDLHFVDGTTGRALNMGFDTKVIRLLPEGGIEQLRELPEQN